MTDTPALLKRSALLRWIKRLCRTTYDTDKRCPCGGRVVGTLSQVGQVHYCEKCTRIDDPDV